MIKICFCIHYAYKKDISKYIYYKNYRCLYGKTLEYLQNRDISAGIYLFKIIIITWKKQSDVIVMIWNDSMIDVMKNTKIYAKMSLNIKISNSKSFLNKKVAWNILQNQKKLETNFTQFAKTFCKILMKAFVKLSRKYFENPIQFLFWRRPPFFSHNIYSSISDKETFKCFN